MKALTIRQPWAWAILWAGKDVENRTWLPSPKQLEPGERFAIHAGLQPDDDWDEAIHRIAEARGAPNEAAYSLGDLLAFPLPRWKDLPRGAIVGTAVLAALDEVKPRSPWGDDCDHWWNLKYVRPIQPPLPCRGGQRLWTVPRKIFLAIPRGAR